MAVMTPVPGSAGSSGAARDLRVYVAADDTTTVVARLAPMVDGPAEHDRIGPIVSVNPQSVRRPEYPGGSLQTLPARVLTGTPRSGAAMIAAAGAVVGVLAAVALAIAATPWLGVPVGAAAALLGGWTAWRRQLRVEHAWADHRVLTRHEDREAMRVAVSNTRYLLRAWPELQTTVALDDPGRTLASTLWELAGSLAERAAVREAALKLERAARAMTADGGPADTRVHADVLTRLDQAREVQQRLDREAGRRLGDLAALAGEVDRFIGQRRAAATAHTVVRDTDWVLGALGAATDPAPGGDPGTELAERTAAVLAAYRELTNNSPR
jgi:hypothetical protein